MRTGTDRVLEQPRVEVAPHDDTRSRLRVVPRQPHPRRRDDDFADNGRRRERTVVEIDRRKMGLRGGADDAVAGDVAGESLAIDDQHTRAGASEQKCRDRSRGPGARDEDIDQRNTIDWCDGISKRRRQRVQLTMSSTR